MNLNNWKAIACFGLLALTVGLTSCTERVISQPAPSSPPAPSVSPPPTTSTAVSRDQELSEKIIGTWQSNRIEDGVALQLEESFYPGDKFSGMAQIENDEGEALYLRYSGTWEIKDSYLHYEITSSNNPDLIPIGDLTVNKIVNVTENDYVYIDQYGNQQVDRRIN
jgi:hypothetical protein